ncbi:MAG: D-alanine--D-alanine ligase [Acidobacteriota bacterium]|nr:D-alanine--D-alanine ligase [Acidobacteriota bacterium]MDH3529747.1 D-alanine--D-alanine ligase [Acidobacteriota bacterium]
MSKKKIGVVFGGRSGEHEISIRSAAVVIEKLSRERYDVVPIAIDREGTWRDPADSLAFLPESARESIGADVEAYPRGSIAIVGDTRYRGLTYIGEPNKEVELDLLFPVLHGTFGEDGTIQGLFEMSGLPYVGCGVLASSCGMDKVVMKTLFRDSELPQCEYVWFLRSEWESNNNLVISQVETKLGYPCFVKPANLGSSVGVTMAKDGASLRRGIDLACKYDRKIIVEEHLDMREIECAVIGNDEPTASLPGEYVVHDESKKFLDYTEKYSATGNNEFVVPALVSRELTEKIQKMAVEAYKAVDAAGFARIDFFLRNDTGALIVNEINTIPGLTEASGFPKMWAGSGLEFEQVLDSLIEYAEARYKDKQRNRTIM